MLSNAWNVTTMKRRLATNRQLFQVLYRLLEETNNRNSYKLTNLLTCLLALACSLAVDVGLCRSNVDRWHFNSIKGKCELFSYSGCEGNKNNFRTLEMCERVCNNYQSMIIMIDRRAIRSLIIVLCFCTLPSLIRGRSC